MTTRTRWVGTRNGMWTIVWMMGMDITDRGVYLLRVWFGSGWILDLG